MPQVPLLLVGDAPTSGTGLGRILSDIAFRAATHLSDVYRVATMAAGGNTSRHLPYFQYPVEGMGDWVMPTLPDIWKDWAGREDGVLFIIWDAARLGWLSRPEHSELLESNPALKQFLVNRRFKLWTYTAIDGAGPNDRLTFPLAQIMLGFDRILAYGDWGESVVRRTLGEEESVKRDLCSLPHGIDTEVFYRRDRKVSRGFFFTITGASMMRGRPTLILPDETLIGIVATNQDRKDWDLAIESVAILSRTRKIRLWIHTNKLESDWSIPALLVDHGLVDRTVISLGYLSDDALAKAYSACDITIAPGAEGFGYPIAESLTCGTPCITGNYAGGAELVPPDMRVEPVGFRARSIWSVKRPAYNPQHWAMKINEWVGCSAALDPKYDWTNNWTGWEKWLREGL